MPADRAEPGSPSDWLVFARSDLAGAEPGPDVLPETLCFHAQQAAEKSIKAVLLHRGVRFPRTHSIELILGLLPADCPRPEDERRIAALSGFAMRSRYPMGAEKVTADQHRRAVAAARAVFEWAQRLVEGRTQT